MRQTTGRGRSQGTAANAGGRTARRRARAQDRRRRRWRLGAAIFLTLVVGVTAYLVAPLGSGVRPALAQVLRGMRTPPRLLTEAEVEAGLVHRLEAMRQRRVYLVERAAERQAAAGERRSPASERQPLPRNPEPIPGDGSTPFTGLAQAPEASLFVGAATTSIPIEVPPSRKGMTPKLALIS